MGCNSFKQKGRTPFCLNFSNTGISELHIRLLKSALLNNIFYYSNGEFGEIETSDLYFKLLNENNHLRYFSTEWTYCFVRLFNTFAGISIDKFFSNLQLEDTRKFNLGLQNVMKICDPRLLEIIKIKNDKNYYSIDRGLFSSSAEEAKLKSFLLIKAIRNKESSLSNKYKDEIKTYMTEYPCEKEYQSRVSMRTALSFYYLVDAPEVALQECQTLISELLSEQKSSMRNHILGVVKYQKGKILTSLGRELDAISCFLESIEFDDSFYDSYYQIASIYHDIGNYKQAKSFYYSALKISAFDQSLVNDYGCLLAESRDQELESWEVVSRSLFNENE